MSTNSISTSGLTAAVFVLLTIAINIAAVHVDSQWSPIQTRSEPVPFAPEFFGRHSDVEYPETIRTIAAIRNQMHTRSHQTHTESSPFASSTKISSVGRDDTQ